MKRSQFVALFCSPTGVLVGLLAAIPAAATHPCRSPLILDLNNDGVRTTDLFLSVRFDINGDGETDEIGWTYPESEEAFLILDLNHNGTVDDGTEMFGNSTILSTGELADNGFDALAGYDLEELGGNGDGLIDHHDLIWPQLRLWLDANHDGSSQPSELRSLPHHKVVAISLEYSEVNELDGNLNLHAFRGHFVKRVRVLGRTRLRAQLVDDVFFIFRPHEP